MAVVLVAHVGVAGLNTSTTSSINTTGANLIVVNVSGLTYTLSDSKGNTWTGLTPGGTAAHSTLFYCENPTVGTGHTFTFTGTGCKCAMQVQAFSGLVGAGAFDQQSQAGGNQFSDAGNPGTITPPSANTLFVTGWEKQNDDGSTGPDTYAVDSGFTITEQFPFTSATNYGGAMAYKVSSSAENPQWTSPGHPIGRTGMTMATFLTTATVTGSSQPIVLAIT